MMVGNATQLWAIPDIIINTITNLMHGMMRKIFLKKAADLCRYVMYGAARDSGKA